MHVDEYGTGDRVVVLVHGIPGSSAIWRAVAENLSSDHRVLVPDLLGFGDSQRPESIDGLWADAQADALREALQAAGVERAVFAGHDFGGPVVLALAQRPGAGKVIAGLCLAATNVFADTPIPLPIRAVTWPLIGALAERVLFSGPSLRAMLRQGSSRLLDPAIYLGDADQQHAIATIFTHALRELESRYAFAAPTLRQLEIPVLVAWGDRDPFFPLAQAERTASAAQHARLAVYAGAGHFLPEERPEQLAADLRQLVRDSSG
jgi:pimeloyl-ACP methyl ester carboxylesterase